MIAPAVHYSYDQVTGFEHLSHPLIPRSYFPRILLFTLAQQSYFLATILGAQEMSTTNAKANLSIGHFTIQPMGRA